MKIKLKNPFQILAFLMAVLKFSMPFVTLAQQNSVQVEAVAAAEQDAQNDVNTSLWVLAGCLGCVVGLGAAYGVEPSPPATRLLGKSPEYVTFYTDAYKEKAKRLQTDSAVGGCVLTTLIVVILAATSTENLLDDLFSLP